MTLQLSFDEAVILMEVCDEMDYAEVHSGDEWKTFLAAQSKIRHAVRSARADAAHQMELLQISQGGQL